MRIVYTRDVYTLAAVTIVIIALGIVYFSMRRKLKRSELRFSAEAQRAIGFARVEAERLRSSSIEASHVLLGLMHVPDPAILEVLPLESHEPIRKEIIDHSGGAALVSYRDDLPFSDEARQVLVSAAREARALGAAEINAEHLLLGVLHAESSVGALVLRERGLRLNTLREQLALTPEYSGEAQT
ncbi:MAG TPA: Clp protease N-terminal domain-containing protein [Terriglobales bacterium]|jgi:ATP-dependent Clp protease ATP-binding subunit ClpC|nr:Clp protease N-terminal domain-containing protein [Terriglobales bacterium]